MRPSHRTPLATACLFMAILPCAFVATTGHAQIPPRISYQAAISDNAGEPISDGEHMISFSLYDQAVDGDVLWTEQHSVTTAAGVVSLILGSTVDFDLPFDRAYWLGVSVDGGEDLSPRVALTTVPYAITAAGVVDSTLTAAAFAADQVVTSIGGVQDDIELVAGANMSITTQNQMLIFTSTASGLTSVSGGNIVDGTIGSIDVADGSLTGADISDNSLMAIDIAAGAVGTSEVADGSLTSTDIASGQFVTAINGFNDEVTLAAGANVTITSSGDTLTIASSGGGGGGGGSVNSVNSLTGDITFAAGSNVTITPSGSTITISSGPTSISSGDIVDGTIGSIDVADGSLAAADIASGQVVTTINGLADNVTLSAGSNVTITPSGSTITIASTASGGTGNTLDGAYDEGGSGAGRTITADNGAVDIQGAGGLTVTGAVGVGTTSPLTPLHVLDATAASMRLERSGGSTWDVVAASDDKLRIDEASTTSPFQIESGAPTNSIYVAADGDVGIGTNAPTTGPPAAQLHVMGTVFAEGNFQNWDGANGVTVTPVGAVSASGNPLTLSRIGNGQVRISDDIRLSPFGATDAVVVEATTGDVGVGTNAPAARLEVKGAGATSATEALMIRNSAGTRLMSINDDGTMAFGSWGPVAGQRVMIKASGTSVNDLILQKHDSTTQIVRIGEDASGSGVIWLVDGTSNSPNHYLAGTDGGHDFLAFFPNSRVGFGTNTPDAKIDVVDGAVLFQGTTGVTPASGAGTRLMWIPAKSAFRAGLVTGTEWDDANIGTASTVGGGEDNQVGGNWSTIGGGINNSAGMDQSTIAGGTTNATSGGGINGTIGGGNNNTVSAGGGTVAGGSTNTASATNATVGGGSTNTASGANATIGGGSTNNATSFIATVAGGQNNTASSGTAPTIGGGNLNASSGDYSTIPGGLSNAAAGAYSFAAGRRAKANHNGAFVFGDQSDFDFASTVADEFSARAVGGVRFVSAIDGSGNATAGVTLAAGGGSWSSISDRNLKANFSDVNGRDVLDALSEIPVQTWNYKSQAEVVRHMGPMAQDFHAAFGIGEDNTRIATIDADGVALAAIQGLYEMVQAQQAQIVALQEANKVLLRRLDTDR